MLERISWGVLALIHLTPALALVRPSLITTLYRVKADNPLFLLLHHRAALFAVILLLCLWAMADPASRRVASVAVGLSMLSFLGLYVLGGSPSALRSIAIADLIGLPALGYVAWRAFAMA
jgi:hypothetical protein